MTYASQSVRPGMAPALLLAFAAAAPAAATDIDPYWLPEVPSEYLGRWNVDAGACNPFDGRQRLVIEPKRLWVGGDVFRISYVGWSEGGGIVISSDYAGKAKPSWNRTDFFKLEKGGQALSGGRFARPVRRVRCR